MWQGIDQRRFPRVRYQCNVVLKQGGESTVIPAATENIGFGGVCVLLKNGLDIFSPVELEINLEDQHPPLRVSGTIVWVVRRREIRKGASFDTGIEFAELQPEAKARIEAVLDKQAHK